MFSCVLRCTEVNAWQETCLASKDAMPFELLKKKLMSRLDTMGVRIIQTYEEVLFPSVYIETFTLR